MADFNLTLRSRNQIGEILEAKGIAKDSDLDAAQLQVIHWPTGSYFRFSYTLHGYDVIWHVTDGPETDWPEPTCKNWEDVLEQISHWGEE